MEIKKTRTIPAKTEEYTDEVICDLCGKTGGDYRCGGINWAARTSYDLKVITVSFDDGESYPEGGQKQTIAYHVCPECWQSKLEPWFTSQGAIPTKSEIEW